MKRRLKILVIIAAAGFLAGCMPQNEKDRSTFSGTLEMTEHSVGAKVAGRLSTLSVDEGDVVTTGERIAELDRYAQAKKDYDRAAALFKQGGATEQSLEYAKLAVDDQEIVAPVNGVVLAKVRETGEIVSAGSAVAVIGDRSELWVKVYIPQSMINRVQSKQEAVIHFDGLKKSFNGHVSYIAPNAEFTPRNVQTPEERVTQTFAVKVVIDNPPDYLRPGVAADVEFDFNGPR